jgi:hypothetical protein
MNSRRLIRYAVGRPAVGSTADAHHRRARFSVTRFTHRDEIWPPSVPSPWSLHRMRGLYIDFRQQVTVPWCDLLVGNAAWCITAKLATDGRDRQMRTSDGWAMGSLVPQFDRLRYRHPVAGLLDRPTCQLRAPALNNRCSGAGRPPVRQASAQVLRRSRCEEGAVKGPKASPILPVGFECGDLLPPMRFAGHGRMLQIVPRPDRGLSGQSPINRTASPPRPKHLFPAEFYP